MSQLSVPIQRLMRGLFTVVMRSTTLRKISLQLLDKAPGLKIKLRGAYFNSLSTQPDNTTITIKSAANSGSVDVLAATVVNTLSRQEDSLSSPLEKYSRSISLVRK